MNLIRAIIMGRARCKRCNDTHFVDYWWKQNSNFVLRKMPCPLCGNNEQEPVTITCKPIEGKQGTR